MDYQPRLIDRFYTLTALHDQLKFNCLPNTDWSETDLRNIIYAIDGVLSQPPVNKDIQDSEKLRADLKKLLPIPTGNSGFQKTHNETSRILQNLSNRIKTEMKTK